MLPCLVNIEDRYKIFRGAFTALVTPFQIDESLDEKALEGLVDFQLNAGIDGLALCGTTGEDQALSLDDRRRIVALVLERVDSRIPIIVGASANVTARAVALAKGELKLELSEHPV